MASVIIMPKQGLLMEEGTITKWLAKEGEQTTEGAPLFEMETDKLTITMDSTATGTVLKILHPEGDTVPITQPIAIVGQPGEDISGLLGGEAPAAAPAAAAPEAPTAEAAPAPQPRLGRRKNPGLPRQRPRLPLLRCLPWSTPPVSVSSPLPEPVSGQRKTAWTSPPSPAPGRTAWWWSGTCRTTSPTSPP